MFKGVLSFVIFIIVGIIIFIIGVSVDNGKDFLLLFLPLIFIEIAFYGSYIIHSIYKIKDKDDNSSDNK